ncbi:paraquat-inducible protein A [Paenalcaligenes sp. Me131]|uniref:paraquat-inducible protein A n=1 Tax=Paenalcaligenes sp. Me131 TaxID=3392636 RepID=UPI003D2CD437
MNHLHACPQCDALHTDVDLQAGESAVCGQCASVLDKASSLTVSGWLALVLGAIILFLSANLAPVVHITLQGHRISPNFPEAIALSWQQGHYSLAVMGGLLGVVFPLLMLLYRLWALLVIRSGRLPLDFSLGLRVLGVLQHWSLVPVVFLAMIVALVKFAGLAQVAPAYGLWAYAALMLVYTSASRLNVQKLWDMAAEKGMVMASAPVNSGDFIGCSACGLVQTPDEGAPCLRCNATLHKRKPDMQNRAWAFLLTAMLLYVPANILPIMVLTTPLGSSSHTILGGVIELWESDSADLALIVFTASIVVPFTKFVALVVLLCGAHRWKGRVVQRQRTRIYELVEFIGQWSMLDVFVVLLLGAMGNFPGLSQIIPGSAALSFGLVVVLTMLSALSFDPRVGWDARTAQQRSMQAVRENSDLKVE